MFSFWSKIGQIRILTVDWHARYSHSGGFIVIRWVILTRRSVVWSTFYKFETLRTDNNIIDAPNVLNRIAFEPHTEACRRLCIYGSSCLVLNFVRASTWGAATFSAFRIAEDCHLKTVHTFQNMTFEKPWKQPQITKIRQGMQLPTKSRILRILFISTLGVSLIFRGKSCHHGLVFVCS